MPTSPNTASKLAVNVVSRSRTTNRNRSACFSEREDEVASLLSHPLPCWMTSHTQDVNAASPDLEDEEHVDPTQQHGVDGEEVTSQHRRRLGPAELAPGRAGAPCSGVQPSLVQDVPDCRRSHPIAQA